MKKKQLSGGCNLLKTLSLTGFLIASSCTTESISDSSLGYNSENDLSSKSIELSVENIVAETEQDENPASNAIDTDSDSRWSGYGDSVDLTLDLATIQSIDYIKIAFLKGDERTNSFIVYTSNDANNWTQINSKTSSGDTENLETYDLVNTEARYIRLEFLGNSENDWNSVTDIEVYGTEGDNEETTSTGYVSIPATIQAENYVTQSGTKSESTRDIGGGENIGYIDTNDYLTYNVNVPETGSYTIDFRVASNSNSSEFDVYQGNSKLTSVSKASTGGWQTWVTTSKTVTLSRGNQTIKILATGGGWNINWISFNQDEDNTEEEEEEEGNGEKTPEDILGSVIEDWKITYPVDEDGNDSSNADDCDNRNNSAFEQLDLTGEISSDYSEYFYVSGDEVVFKAHVGGATTTGSNYPRSEFRQLVGGGNNYWSMDDYQYLEARVRATHLPTEKPEVSMMQIHGPDDEPLRVEYRSDTQGLHVVQNEDDVKEYVMDYELGQQLFVTVTVDNGDISLYMKNEDTGETYNASWEAEDSTGYFKIGCYTQSNNNLETCKPGEGFENQNADEYGEVRIKDLKLVETY